MTKSELAKKISESSNVSKAETERLITAVFDAITNEMIEGNEVFISGFGKFYVREVGERKVRNPRTGEELIAPPRKIAAFRAFKSLKKGVNDSKE